MNKFSKALGVLSISLMMVSTPVAHADVDDQGPLASMTTGATASKPAVRLTPPQPVVTIPRTTEQMIRDVWPDDLEEHALRIAYRESRYECCVHTWCCYGVFQIYLNVHKSWLNEMGIYTIADLYVPLNNIKAAYQLYLIDGWSPWQT